MLVVLHIGGFQIRSGSTPWAVSSAVRAILIEGQDELKLVESDMTPDLLGWKDNLKLLFLYKYFSTF